LLVSEFSGRWLNGRDYLCLRDFQARYITAEMRNVESSAFGNDGK
jgi:hypothetical protein